VISSKQQLNSSAAVNVAQLNSTTSMVSLQEKDKKLIKQQIIKNANNPKTRAILDKII
jgi:hypothetical protein